MPDQPTPSEPYGDPGRAPVDRRMRARDAMLILLTAGSGAVDAVCFLGLGHVFTAVVTGNLVLLGLGLGTAEWAGVLRSATAVAGYLCGVVLTAPLLPHAGPGDPWPRRLTYAIGAELALQTGAAVTWAVLGGHPAGWTLFPLIGAYGLAMGAQSAVAQAVAVRGVTTTYVTGTATGLITDLMRGSRGGRRRRAVVVSAVPVGALATALLLRVLPPVAPFLPVALTLSVLVAGVTVFWRAAGSGRQ